MLPTELERALTARVRDRQRTWRAAGLVAGVVREGGLEWSIGVGAADVSHPDPNTGFAIGSITKTFTAALIMSLRDEGKLALSDRLDRFLPEAPADSPTLRDLLAHASGLQREAPGDVWESLQMPDVPSLMAQLDSADRVLPARWRWHYSNLGYSLLGAVVAEVDGRSWATALQERLLDPLGMKHTRLDLPDQRATGYYTDPFTDQVHPEPWPRMNAFDAAGGLWSTLADLGRWAAFLCSGADGVLTETTLAEMARPEIIADLERWTLAWGLGLALYRSGERILVGHGGGMPGFVSGVAVDRREGVAAIVLANTSAGAEASALAVELACQVLDEDPLPPAPWRPGPPVPAQLQPLVGQWWSEGNRFTFAVRDGKLEAQLDGPQTPPPPAVFEPLGVDEYRTVSGREEGELLRVIRAGDGSVVRMNWAGYPFTRTPQTFG
jgi:CubicO group peptidase (beta-lactamase class C family)